MRNIILQRKLDAQTAHIGQQIRETLTRIEEATVELNVTFVRPVEKALSTTCKGNVTSWKMHVNTQRNKHLRVKLYIKIAKTKKSLFKHCMWKRIHLPSCMTKNGHCMWKCMIVCLNIFKTNCSLHVETYGCKVNHFTVLFTVARICI